MASYFDLPPQQNEAAASIEGVPEEQRKQMGGMSMLSPAITQLLDDLGAEPSDSESEEGNLSEQEDTRHPGELTKTTDAQMTRHNQGLDTSKPAKSPHSSKEDRARDKRPVHSSLSPARAEGSGSSKPRLKPKQPHMARFHSLRSMLFSNTIEGKIKSVTLEDPNKEEAAAEKWNSQHDHAQMPHRAKTPEEDAQDKPHGLGSRLKTSIRRMTTKDVPTMQTLQEDSAAHDFSDHDSTASSDAEPQPHHWKPREADEESIDHSDIEDLVRWVSRRDPPSPNSANPPIPLSPTTSHTSLASTDISSLVQHATRPAPAPAPSYSDASTESDDDLPDHSSSSSSSDAEDTDDLVRWISRRAGPAAGPIRHTGSPARRASPDSDVPELGRWVTRRDADAGAASPRGSLDEERGRGRARARSKGRGHISHEDVGELVRWVSRDGSKGESAEEGEGEKKKRLGMAVDEGSLSHGDLQELVEYVRGKETGDLEVGGGEKTADLDVSDSQDSTSDQGAGKLDAEEYSPANTSATSAIESERRGSLGPEDVDELVRWVSRKA